MSAGLVFFGTLIAIYSVVGLFRLLGKFDDWDGTGLSLRDWKTYDGEKHK